MSLCFEFEHHEGVIREAIEHLDTLPEHLRAGMQNYLRDGLTPGGFMCAVLDNDLIDAVAHCSDKENAESLIALCLYLLYWAPALAYGSPEKRKAWQEQIAELTQRLLLEGATR